MVKTNWKKWSAIGCAFALAAVLCCLIPAGTMQAAAPGAPTVTVQCGGQTVGISEALGQPVEYNVLRSGSDYAFAVSTTGGESATFSYLLETAKEAAGKNAEALAARNDWSPLPEDNRISFQADGYYLLYLKAEYGQGQTAYFCSSGVIKDTQTPVFKGIQHGGSYPPSQTFTVEDATQVEVLLNGTPAAPDESGKYTVQAREDSSACTVTAKDAAGNETTISVTVVNTTISLPNTYSLSNGTPYKLAGGTWNVESSSAKDPSVYEVPQGGATVYVRESGDYTLFLNSYWNFDWSNWWNNWWTHQ